MNTDAALWIGIGFLVCGLIAGAIASERGANVFVWFFLGSLVGPFGIMAALSSGPGAKCPECRKAIDKDARKCPYCQSVVKGVDETQPAGS